MVSSSIQPAHRRVPFRQPFVETSRGTSDRAFSNCPKLRTGRPKPESPEPRHYEPSIQSPSPCVLHLKCPLAAWFSSVALCNEACESLGFTAAELDLQQRPTRSLNHPHVEDLKLEIRNPCTPNPNSRLMTVKPCHFGTTWSTHAF